MPSVNTVCVRLSDEEKRQLKKYGNLSQTIRNALQLYLNTKKSEELLSKLSELQAKNPVKTSRLQEVEQIKEDRNR